MKKYLEYWLMRDAEWYEFYFPKSGLSGGLIFGTLILVIGLTTYNSL